MCSSPLPVSTTPPREKLTFSQAEGLEPLPAPLRLGELSKPLRNAVLAVLFRSIEASTSYRGAYRYVTEPWSSVLFQKHTHIDLGPPDRFSSGFDSTVETLKQTCLHAPFNKVLDLLEFFVRESETPKGLRKALNVEFERYSAPYRITDPGPCIIPTATREEGLAVARAFADLAGDAFAGARKHLREAGVYLGQPGKQADSVRESIHAVEAVCRVLANQPKATLDDALKVLASKVELHGGFRKALGNLYGYTSDEEGIRHSLLEDGNAKVDLADAQFMFGACASFVSYLIGKARTAGVI